MIKNITFLECEKKMPLMKLPVRSSLVQLRNASVLFSPGSKLTTEQLKSLGNVTDIVGPNLLHLAGVPLAIRTFPQAKLWGPKGAHEKRPEINWPAVTSEEIWPFQSELPMVSLAGVSRLNEMVFIHRESKSLIVSDLVFNLVDASGLGARIILGLFGTYRKFGISKLFVKSINDKIAFKRSIDQLMTYDFDNIIMGHGHIVEGNGKALLQKALTEREL